MEKTTANEKGIFIMAKADTIEVVEPEVLTSKELEKADGRGKDAVKTPFVINCWPIGNNAEFIANAVEGLGIGFVVRAVSQELSIDARSAFVKGLDMATWFPNADGTASSGDGYAPLRRQLRNSGVPEHLVEGHVELAKQQKAEANS